MRAISWVSALILLLLSVQAAPTQDSEIDLTKRQFGTAPKPVQRTNSLPVAGNARPALQRSNSLPVTGNARPGLQRSNSLPVTGNTRPPPQRSNTLPVGRPPVPGLQRANTLPALGSQRPPLQRQGTAPVGPLGGAKPNGKPPLSPLPAGQQGKPLAGGPLSPNGKPPVAPKGQLPGAAPVAPKAPALTNQNQGSCGMRTPGGRLMKRCDGDDPTVSLMMCGRCALRARALLNVLDGQCWHCYGQNQYTNGMIEIAANDALNRLNTQSWAVDNRLGAGGKITNIQYPRHFGNKVGGTSANSQQAVITSGLTGGTLYEFPIFTRKTYTGGDPETDRVVIEVTQAAGVYTMKSIHVITHARADGNAFNFVSPSGGAAAPAANLAPAPPPAKNPWGPRRR